MKPGADARLQPVWQCIDELSGIGFRLLRRFCRLIGAELSHRLCWSLECCGTGVVCHQAQR